jgi:uncharacterized membrane protein
MRKLPSSHDEIGRVILSNSEEISQKILVTFRDISYDFFACSICSTILQVLCVLDALYIVLHLHYQGVKTHGDILIILLLYQLA